MLDEPLLSLIVPVGPGDQLDQRLHHALNSRPANCELIISAAAPAAQRWPRAAVALVGPAGRARQLNAGAQAASASWLWFVHADSVIEPAAIDQVMAFARQSHDAIGYGWLRFLPDGPKLLRLNALGANLRSQFFGLPYGDQSLCMAARRWQTLGGFREDLQRGEDLDLLVRARSAGLPARPMGVRVATSARRYRERGWLRLTWQHQLEARRLIRSARCTSRQGRP